jgi:hypothetical protein
MILLSVNMEGDGALKGIPVHHEASAIEIIVLEDGTSGGRPSVTIHMTVGDDHVHIIGQTSARLFCTAARMILAKYPDLFDDE